MAYFRGEGALRLIAFAQGHSNRRTVARALRARTMSETRRVESNGGERGIRTPETLAGLTVFKTVAFDHSAISPRIL